ncbi:MarR family winged helix-turn-helix transcriptional regulator [Actinocatenispora rupis]|uniref:MarR family transcriptional regulator n=1 Tax=Actinocatenispora rupis TaxID=519421 RepID=A0A8J3NFP1_9ACTN|nr:MarR family transcriptional regulator [Actinocatenispora rupis]GID15095.1 MarR family transcriptional regulator [Actinocatenispora rupis]
MSGSSAPAAPPDDEELTLADRLGDQLVRFLRLVGRNHTHLPEVYKEGIEKVGYVLLWRLVTEGPQRTTALAEAVHSDISTISRQVTALVKQGWVERTQDPEDGRAFLLAATDAGVHIYERIRDRRNEHMARILSRWPADDRHQLVELLDRFNNDFEDYLPRAQGEGGTTTQQRGEKVG